MLKQKSYSCGICNSKPDQLSHHKSHLETQKHKDKKELFELKLCKLTIEELQDKYNITNIIEIVNNTETIEQKKMNEIYNDELSHEFMSMLKDNMIDETMSISNKDALKDKIHDIHNFLRNNGAGYGMNALKVFNIIYGLKKIEENNLLEKANLKKPDCEFSYLLKLANENKDEQLTELIFGSVLTSISESNIRELLFYEIPQNIRGSVFVYLIKEINKITLIEKSCNVLLSGKIYEYFIGRDESAISELGAYFTDRHIVDYIYKKLQPTLSENDELETMIDMFGGSGGFTTGYINYMKEHFNINWETDISKVYHYDMNEDVIKSAGLEFFCLTGVLPNMKNLQYKNSFTDEFVGEDGRTEQKYKYVITNPPYGGDKNNKSEAQVKREKIKEYIKKELVNIKDEEQLKRCQQQLKHIEMQEKLEKKEQEKQKVTLESSSKRIQRFARKYKLKGTDKEACSLILMMDLLDINGTCIGVLKEGVFFNKTYKDLRKTLIENYNVSEVISVPSDQFENTSTKTSIVIFDNKEEKTTNVKFSNLTIERYEEDKFEEYMGYIYLTESKDDIKNVSDTLITEATREELIVNNICSLNGKDYNKKEIICGKNYKLVKLGDISEFLSKSKRNASFGQLNGKYNFYTSSDKVQKCDIADYNEESIIIGSGGVANIKIDNIFSCSADNFILKLNNNKYIYYLLKGNMKFLIDGFTGSTLKHISKEYLQNLQIPIPKSEEKIKEWVDKISKPYDKKIKKEQELKDLEIEIQNKIKYITENENCEEVELGSILNLTSGKFKSSDSNKTGLYPFYNGKAIQPDGLSDKYCYDSNEYIIIIKDGGAGVGKYGDQIGLGNVFFQTGKCGFTSHQLALELKINKIINIKYIFHYLKINKNNIMDLANYSTGLGTITKNDLSKFIIKIPKNKELIDNLEPLFNKIEILQTKIKENEKLYNQFIQELSNEALPKTTIINQSSNEVIVDEPINEVIVDEPINEVIVEEPSNRNIKKTIKKTKNAIVI
jgi:restriction endonuclease S subunit